MLARITLLATISAATIGGAARPVEGRAPSYARTAHAAASDSLLVDPALVMGTLPNGMRYYLRVNRRPAHRAMLWLAVDAGSVLEDEDQKGYAHFLEHMAFNGTTHFPRNELVDYLQTAGMRFGADLNAATSYDETVYKLEVPTDEPEYLGRGLQMLEDWASGGIRIDSSEVVAERGVVLGEWRSRLADTLTQKVQAHHDSVLLGDSRYRTRIPIGTPASIGAAEPGPIRRFYHDWYRPDLMAVVVVGDFDPRVVEREIRARFGAIPARADRRPRIRPALPSGSKPVIDVYRGPVYPVVTAYWKEPPHRFATSADFRDLLIERLLFAHLERRILELRERPGRPFIAASVNRTRLTRGADAHFIRVTAEPESLVTGMAALLTEIERVAQNGVPDVTLRRAKAVLLRQFESAATAQAAQPSERYAAAYVEHYLRGDAPLPSAQQQLALAKRLLPGIAPADLAHAAAFWRRRRDLVVQVDWSAFAHAAPPTSELILASMDSVAHQRLAPESAVSARDATLLASLPAAGRILSEKRYAKAGIIEWTLSNGARVLLKPMAANADELLIDARSPGGYSLLPDTLFFGPGRLVAQMMTQAAGLGAEDRDGLDQKLAIAGLHELEVSITPTDESITLAGSPAELETLFQTLYLQFTAPKLDTAALAIWRQVGSVRRHYSLATEIARVLSRGNPRLAPPSRTLMQFADTASAMAVYRDRFGNAGDFTFTLVGAVTPERIRPLVERYIASLPSTGKREVPQDLGVLPWDRPARQLQRVYDIPKASTQLFFEGSLPSSPDAYIEARRRLDALAWVLRLRCKDILRERMGGTYGVAVLPTTFSVPQEHYGLAIAFDAAPDRMDGMIDTLFTILDTVRATGATPHELRQVMAMQRRVRENELQDDRYWLNTIESYDRLGIPLDRIVEPPAAPLTSEDIRIAAQSFLPAHAYISVTAVPRDSTLH